MDVKFFVQMMDALGKVQEEVVDMQRIKMHWRLMIKW